MFFRKFVRGRPVAFYAAKALLEQDLATTTWENDLDHARERVTLFVLKIARRADAHPSYQFSFVQATPAEILTPTCEPAELSQRIIELIRANRDLTAYPDH